MTDWVVLDGICEEEEEVGAVVWGEGVGDGRVVGVGVGLGVGVGMGVEIKVEVDTGECEEETGLADGVMVLVLG
jgi:hypothetical protein